jgi:hypothetical protein
MSGINPARLYGAAISLLKTAKAHGDLKGFSVDNDGELTMEFEVSPTSREGRNVIKSDTCPCEEAGRVGWVTCRKSIVHQSLEHSVRIALKTKTEVPTIKIAIERDDDSYISFPGPSWKGDEECSSPWRMNAGVYYIAAADLERTRERLADGDPDAELEVISE